MAYFNPNQGAINDLLTSLYGQGSGQVYTSSTPESELPSQIRALRKLNELQRPMGDGGGQDVYNDFSKFDMRYIPRETKNFSNAAKPSMDFDSLAQASYAPAEAYSGNSGVYQGGYGTDPSAGRRVPKLAMKGGSGQGKSTPSPIVPQGGDSNITGSPLESGVAFEQGMENLAWTKRLGLDSEAFQYGSSRDRAGMIQAAMAGLTPEQRKGLQNSGVGNVVQNFLSTEAERQSKLDQAQANSLIELMASGRIYRGENGTPVRKVQKKVQDPNDPFGEKKIVEVEEPVSYTQMQMFAKAQKQGLLPKNSFDFRLPHEKVTDYSGSTKHTMGFNPGNMPNYSRPAPAPAFRDSVNAIVPGALNSLRQIGLFSSGISPVEAGMRAATGYEGKLPSDLIPKVGSPDIASKLAALKAYFFRPNE